MKRKNLILAAVALVTATGAVSAPRNSPDLRAEFAISVGKLIGLSPEGVRLWASHAVATDNRGDFKHSSQLHAAMGQELARDRPSRAVLTRLSGEIAAEQARLATLDQERLLTIAFRLSDGDRKALGLFMVRAADDGGRGSSAILQPLP